jgi:anti-repressor protein
MKVDYNSETPTVLGRELHAALEVETPYHIWFPRMTEYGFTAGQDYIEVMNKNVQNPSGGRPSTDHQLTIEMAKEICMIQRTEKGKQFRQYFIELEKKWNSPETVMARALQMANKRIEDLQTARAELVEQNAALLPKGEYYDTFVERDTLTGLRDTAKLLNVKEHKFIDALIEKKYLYRDQKRALAPYAKKNAGFFEVKQYASKTSKATGIQTMVTVKGREHFAKLFAS